MRFRFPLAALALAIASAGLSPSASASVATVIAFDNFDTNQNRVSFNATPDKSGTNGLFLGIDADPGDFDAFGVTNRAILLGAGNDTLVDTSLSGSDGAGILQSMKTDNVFALQDVKNDDNPFAPFGTAQWVFDVSGYTNLSVSIDFAAIGDFDDEDGTADDDILGFTAQVGSAAGAGAVQDIFTFTVIEGVSQIYTLESTAPVAFEDPLSVNGTLLNNNLQKFTAPVSGSDAVLTLTFNVQQDSSSEAVVIDNILIEGDLIPEPSAAALLLLAGAMSFRRRRGA